MTFQLYYTIRELDENGTIVNVLHEWAPDSLDVMPLVPIRPKGMPGRGIQVILQNDPQRGPYFQSTSDNYVWYGDHWRGVNDNGLWDYMLDTGLVIFGRTVRNEEYQAIYRKAKGDKTQFLPGERKP